MTATVLNASSAEVRGCCLTGGTIVTSPQMIGWGHGVGVHGDGSRSGLKDMSSGLAPRSNFNRSVFFCLQFGYRVYEFGCREGLL